MDQMNDLEDLVRRELRAHVDAVEAMQADEPSVLLGALDRRIRRARLRRRWTASALSAVAIAAAITIPLASLAPRTPIARSLTASPGSVPLSDTSVTPTGWLPVAYGDAQISVPADWRVASRPCGHEAPGYVLVATTSTSPRCRHASNVAAIEVLPPGRRQTQRRSGYINGIPVLGVRPVTRGYASFLAPTLHVLISVRGPLGNKILGTLTRSPFSVVLAAGPHVSVPQTWRWRDFGGIRFATPARWRTIKSRVWYPCWAAITSAQAVELVNATRAAAFSCSSGGPGIRPGHGVVVGAGRYVAPHRPARDGCRSLHGMRACFAMPGPGAPLELIVDVPGRQRPTVIDIGLAGNGLEARTIFDSIRPR
jgi:hypothetical protein